MRSPGEIAETNNLNRPRIGIIVAQNNPLINNTILNSISQNSRSMNNSSSNSIKRFENLEIDTQNSIFLQSKNKSTNNFSSQISPQTFLEKCQVNEFSLVSLKSTKIDNSKINIISDKIIVDNNLSKTVKKTEKITVDIVDKRIINPRENFMNKNSFKHIEVRVKKSLILGKF